MENADKKSIVKVDINKAKSNSLIDINKKGSNISDISSIVLKISETMINAIQSAVYSPDRISMAISEIKVPQYDYRMLLSAAANAFSRISDSYNFTFRAISSFLSSLDFTKYLNDLDEQNKRKIACYLHFDIYPPLLFIDEMLDVELEKQEEANIFLREYLRFWEEEYGRTVYDFIPKSLKTFKEIEQLQSIENLKMYKMMVIFCCERIENVLAKLQIQEQGKKRSDIQVSQSSFRNFMDTSNNDECLKKLISQIAYISEYHEKGYREINLFKKFKDLEEEYDNETLPLNRNLFMHGLVDEKYVDYLMVQKAILAYAFFEQLFVLKTSSSKENAIKILKRKGISKIPRRARIIAKAGEKYYEN